MREAAADIGGNFEDSTRDEGKCEPGAVAEELDREVEGHEGEEGGKDDCARKGGVVVVEDDSRV